MTANHSERKREKSNICLPFAYLLSVRLLMISQIIKVIGKVDESGRRRSRRSPTWLKRFRRLTIADLGGCLSQRSERPRNNSRSVRRRCAPIKMAAIGRCTQRAATSRRTQMNVARGFSEARSQPLTPNTTKQLSLPARRGAPLILLSGRQAELSAKQPQTLSDTTAAASTGLRSGEARITVSPTSVPL